MCVKWSIFRIILLHKGNHCLQYLIDTMTVTQNVCPKYKVRAGKNGRCVYVTCPVGHTRKGGSCVEKPCKKGLQRVGSRCRVKCTGSQMMVNGRCQTMSKPNHVMNKITGRLVKADGAIGLWIKGKGPNPYGSQKSYRQYAAKKL